MKKKVLAAVLTVCIAFGTSAAFAQARRFDGREHQNLQQVNHPVLANRQDGREHWNLQADSLQGLGRRGSRGNWGLGRNCRGSLGFGGRGRIFAPDMPQEIREKAVELAKLRIDLEEAVSTAPLNKDKAIEIHAKLQKLGEEIDAWKFQKKLNMIEEVRKQRELNKTVSAQPAAEKTEAK